MALETAKGLLAVWTDIAPEIEAEFNAWYDTEHIPERLSVPGFLSGLRFVAVDGQPKYLALYELSDAEVRKSEAWKQAADSDWTKRMRPHFHDVRAVVSRRIA